VARRIAPQDLDLAAAAPDDARPAADDAVAAAGSGAGSRPDPASVLPVGPKAPAVRASGWLNTAALAPADLAGKVVLYDFWTFGCVNCRNTQPHVKAWHARYAKDGLVVLSIHTPEFGYEADPANVRRYVADNGITYPVALDPDSTVWDAFGNHYWPQFYLHDRQGHRRLVRIGEGSYDSTEDAIRALLGVPTTAPRASVE
jgi:thiol-disulfide isomerase/thioredoxin